MASSPLITIVSQLFPKIYNQQIELEKLQIYFFFCCSKRYTYNMAPQLRCDVYIRRSAQKCKMIFDEPANASVEWLHINGEVDVVPDLSDASNKFENLLILEYENLKLKIVERSKVGPFEMITDLSLGHNEISQLSSDTFHDFKNVTYLQLEDNQLREIDRSLFSENRNMKRLFLNDNEIEFLPADLFRNNKELVQLEIHHNQLKDLHPDLLQDLGNLRFFYANDNQIEILLEGLFRDNHKLIQIRLQNNKLKTIATEFEHLTELNYIHFEGNVCIDEVCDVREFCGSTSMIEMQRRFWSKCVLQ